MQQVATPKIIKLIFILEPIVNLSEKVRRDKNICVRCYALVEKFDDLQEQTRRVQEKLCGMLQHSKSEEIYIKQEPQDFYGDYEPSSSDESCDDEGWVKKITRIRPRTSNQKSATDQKKDDFVQHDKDTFCDECSKSFKNALCFQMHLATDHDRNKGEVDCPICFKTYKDVTALKKHYNIHLMPRSLLCGQ